MPSQTQAISFVQHVQLKQFAQFFRMFGLFIYRIERASDDLPRRIRIPGDAFAIERFLFPPVIDAGKNLVLTVPGDHLQEGTATIALKVFAVKLDKGVFAGGKAGAGRHAGNGLKMDAADFALGDFREQRVERYHNANFSMGRAIATATRNHEGTETKRSG
jgi:hypothetical protein